MDNLRTTLAQNLTKLRLKSGLTQSELAKKINYSDKSISKWENAESVPSIEILKEIADIYGVTVDYLINPIVENFDNVYVAKENNANKLIITLLSVSLVWLIATLLYFYGISLIATGNRFWILFVAAVPVSIIVLLVFNSIWGNLRFNYLLISIGIWSLLATIFLLLYHIRNFWSIFLIGIPLQIATILWANLKKNKKKA